jgi:hypothetical protein
VKLATYFDAVPCRGRQVLWQSQKFGDVVVRGATRMPQTYEGATKEQSGGADTIFPLRQLVTRRLRKVDCDWGLHLLCVCVSTLARLFPDLVDSFGPRWVPVLQL